MIKTSNSKARVHVINLETFKGSNTFGEWTNDKTYVVYSYGYHFPMYVFQNGVWYENSDKYSVSTSKQQTQLRPFLGSQEMSQKDTNELKLIISFPQFDDLKTYTITHRGTRERMSIKAETFTDGCLALGWKVCDCYYETN